MAGCFLCKEITTIISMTGRFDATRFEWIKPYAELNDNKRKIILSHYPIFCYNGQYRRNKEGNRENGDDVRTCT